MKKPLSRLLFSAGLAALLAPFAAPAANPCVILPDGRKVEGTEVRVSREGVVTLVTGAGRVEYPKGTKVVMDEPKELIRAAGLVQKKQYDEAIPVLEKAVDDYRFLGWDVKARKLLAASYTGKEDWAKAVAAYDSLMADVKETADDESVRAGYLQALAGSGNKEKTLPLLTAAIEKGPREEAARAQMIRARFRIEDGDVEGALYDYMRTSRFFREFKDLAGEATFRAAECLEKLGDVEQAGRYFRQTVQDYPDSPFTAQAKAKAGTKP